MSVSVSNPKTEPLRKFLTKFFQTVKNSTWTLSDDCLAGQFDVKFEKIVEALKASDFFTAITLLRDIRTILNESCPIQDLNAIHDEINNAIHSGAITKNIFNHLQDLITLIAEEDKHMEDLDLEELGCFLGKLYKLVVIGTPHNLRFLQNSYPVPMQLPYYSSPVLKGKVYDFITGFIEGTSDVPFESNQCRNNTLTFLPALSDAVEVLYNALMSRTGIKEAFTNLMATAIRLKDVENYCHFIALATTFITIENPITIAKIAARITTNILTLCRLVKDGFKAQINGDFRTSGKSLGAVFSIIQDRKSVV